MEGKKKPLSMRNQTSKESFKIETNEANSTEWNRESNEPVEQSGDEKYKSVSTKGPLKQKNKNILEVAWERQKIV